MDTWSAVAAGDDYTVAIKDDGSLWAWGSNLYGQLGDGTNEYKYTPTQEATGATNWFTISAGDQHTVALKSDGTLWARGHNGYGQLGDGTFITHKNTPTQESTGATDWSAVAAGLKHTVALKSDGTLWSWGWNGQGQLGDGTTVDKTNPTQESTGATDWSAITAGFYHAVALKSDGTLWAWGSNGQGRLGDGSNVDKTTPTQESTGSTNWSAIAAGTAHTVALKSSVIQPTPTPTPIPSTSAWGLAALAAALLVMSAILLRRTSGRRPATRP